MHRYLPSPRVIVLGPTYGKAHVVLCFVFVLHLEPYRGSHRRIRLTSFRLVGSSKHAVQLVVLMAQVKRYCRVSYLLG